MFKTIIRPKTNGKNEIEDLQDWLWPSMDEGSWGSEENSTGPLGDWLKSHKHEWFRTVRNFDVCIQAGGNMGMYQRLLSDIFKTVYTFEPHPLSFHCLVNNCQKTNIVKINAALGPVLGLISNQFTEDGADNLGMNTIDTKDDSYIPMLTIDSFNLKSCGLIALDVEGFEAGVLAGALQTISQFRPVIIGERTDSAEFVNVLSAFGYEKTGQSVSDTIYTSINN